MKIMHFHCRHCGQPMQCPEQDITLEVKCGHCHKSFVPAPEKVTDKVILAKFHCPNCHEKIKADSAVEGREVTCPSCQFKFIPAIEETAEDMRARADEPSTLAWAKPDSSRELHDRASSTGMAGTILLVISLIAIIIVWAGDSDIRPAATIVAGGCFFFALFLFLIAQLIHIRANTEK